MINKRIVVILVRVATAMVVCFYALRLLDSRNELYILHDEFAYWAIAAKYGGYDWSSMMKDSGYYSMGYSLFLVPLFHLGIRASLMYKIAIILNVFFVLASYFISCAVAKMLFEDFDENEISIVCGIISFYPYLTTQSNYAWPEVFLYFLFWLDTFLICRFAETGRLKWGFLAIAEGVWMFFVHQRTIGIFIASVIAVIFIIIRNIQQYKGLVTKKNFLFWFLLSGAIVVFAVLFGALKQYNLHYIFSQKDIVQINDFSGQVSKVRSIFSLKGIQNFLLSFAGKYFYFCVSTLLLGPFALMIIVKKIAKAFLSFKLSQWQDSVYLFWLLAFLAMISITSIFTINNYMADEISTRIDIIFYGRYFECTMGPLFLTALCVLKKQKKGFIFYFLSVVQTVIVTLVTFELVHKVRSFNKVDLSAAAFNYFFWLTDDYKKAILHGAVLSISIFVIVILLIHSYGIKKAGYWFALALICAMWMKETNTNDDIIRMRENENETYVYNVAAYLEDMRNLDNLTYIYTEEDRNLYQRYAFYLQYNLYGESMQKLECSDQKDIELEQNTVYVVMEDSSLMETMNKKCTLLYSNKRVNLFQLKENP